MQVEGFPVVSKGIGSTHLVIDPVTEDPCDLGSESGPVFHRGTLVVVGRIDCPRRGPPDDLGRTVFCLVKDRTMGTKVPG